LPDSGNAPPANRRRSCHKENQFSQPVIKYNPNRLPKREERNAEVTILLREKGNLQVEVASLKKELEIREQKLSVQTEDEAYFSQLRLNRDILKKYLSSSPLFLEKLEQEGFNLSFATHIGMLYEKQYFCILEMGYRQKKNLIYIKQL
jgi:hypothetical protein